MIDSNPCKEERNMEQKEAYRQGAFGELEPTDPEWA